MWKNRRQKGAKHGMKITLQDLAADWLWATLNCLVELKDKVDLAPLFLLETQV